MRYSKQDLLPLLKSSQKCPINTGSPALCLRDMATEELDQLSENLPFATRHGMWFTHDGDKARVAREVKYFLPSQYADRNGQGCVLRDRPISHLPTTHTAIREVQFVRTVRTRCELRRLIEAAAIAIWYQPGMFQDTRNSWQYQVQSCALNNEKRLSFFHTYYVNTKTLLR